ncbi:MAG: hypothetical protein ACUVQM_06675 [Candidatus Hadarchaeaceae archaeon]
MSNPYLISIEERVELIAESFKARQKTTEETLTELKEIVTEINTANEEQNKKGLNIEWRGFFYLLDFEKSTGKQSRSGSRNDGKGA